MKVKKLGKAKIDLRDEMWFVDGADDKFFMNRRLVDTRPEIKEFKSSYAKIIQSLTPPRRKILRREEYFTERDQYEKEWKELLKQIYATIEEESHQYPVLLQKHKDYNHPRQWLYCLYQGRIYEFDKQGYSDEEMIQGIRELEPPINPS